MMNDDHHLQIDKQLQQQQQQQHRKPPPSRTNKTIILTLTLSILFRSLIAYHPHSGQNNHHGSKKAYGGDFEAQRHWMEITIHLPLHKWYTYDTQYWGLDYPPLTAYGSYILGHLSQIIVGKDCVALDESRGYEHFIHKAFMRGTVIGLDVILYFPIVYMIVKRLISYRYFCGGIDNMDNNNNEMNDMNLMIILIGVFIQPALLIIDHGHFQYNAVCLSFALASFHFITKNDSHHHHQSRNIGWNSIIGSLFFCLALNWKQMILYYAPAVFAYLLGRCFCTTATNVCNSNNYDNQNQHQNMPLKPWQVFKHIFILGITVLTTFGVLWFPFYHYRESVDQSIIDVFGIILKRIFPFSRGLFEGKVGNLWCAASVKPLSIRERIPTSIQPLCALCLTILMALPFCILLFKIGMNTTRKSHNNNAHLVSLLWGAAGSSLSFFLASFQVHEKSILLPLAPLSLFVFTPVQSPSIHWFSIVSIWSMWHLVVIDRLQIPYVVTIITYLCYIYVTCINTCSEKVQKVYDDVSIAFGAKYGKLDIMIRRFFLSFIIPASIMLMIGLHILEVCIIPPPTLPDLFPVLWVIVSCASFCIMWIISLWELFLSYLIVVGIEKGEIPIIDQKKSN